LALALIFGGAMLALTPPFQVADEENHFRRSCELAAGRVIPQKRGDYTGDDLPRSIEALWGRYQPLGQHREQKTSLDEILQSASERWNVKDTEFVAFSNTAIHPPLTYLPQALGISIARAVSPSVLVGFYTARILNFLAAVALTFVAIRLTPVLKYAFAALALTPMALYQAASLSSDALTNAFALLLVAQVLACAAGPAEVVRTRSIVGMAIWSVAVGLAKQAYFLLPVTYLLIPVGRAGTSRRYWSGFALALGAGLLPVVVWSFVVKNVYSSPDLHYAIDPAEQFHRLFSRWPETLRMLGNTAMRSRVYGEEYLGFLGWLDTRLPDWFYIAEVVLLLYLCVSDPEAQRRLSARQAWLAGSVALLVGGMVLFIVHLTWDPLGTPYIVIQGRHLIPLGPVVAIAMSKSGWFLPRPLVTTHWLKPFLLSIGTATFLSTAIYNIYDRFYVDNDVARAERLYQQGLSLAKARDTREQAYALFDEALAIDSGHPGAHYMLGIRSETNDSRAAAMHFRSVLAREPGHVSSMLHLATALAELSEYDEAIRFYEGAVRLRPDDAKLRNDLARAKRTQGLLSQVEATMQSLARRQARGGNLAPNRGPVVVEPGQMSLPAPFVWRCPPPSGQNIPQEGSADRTLLYPFYACSAIAFGGKRVFVFPPPLGAMLLADEDVSWYWQLPLSDLTPDQRQEEIVYRKARNLQFPLTTLPEPDPSK
jgi:uncharacterized membrane protein